MMRIGVLIATLVLLVILALPSVSAGSPGAIPLGGQGTIDNHQCLWTKLVWPTGWPGINASALEELYSPNLRAVTWQINATHLVSYLPHYARWYDFTITSGQTYWFATLVPLDSGGYVLYNHPTVILKRCEILAVLQ